MGAINKGVVKQYIYYVNSSNNSIEMSESIENLTSHQTTFTFCRQSSKDNPENLFESVVDSHQNETSTKSNSINKPHTLDNLYRQKIKSSAESNELKSMYQSAHEGMESPIRKEREQMEEYDEVQYCEIQEFHSYLDLTSKLQSALNKNQKTKRTANNTSRNNNTILRFEELEEKKKQQIRRLKEQRDYEITKNLKEKPQINKKSEKLMKEIRHDPIYVRYEKILESKKKQYQLNKQIKARQQQQKQAEFFEEFQKHVKKPQNVRSYDQYFNEMVRWKERKAQQNRQKFQKKSIQQIQGLTFQPTISNKSRKLMQGQKRLPISQRGLIRQKPKPMYTFTPNISIRQQK